MKKAIEKLMQLFNVDGDQVLLNTAFSRKIIGSLISKAIRDQMNIPVEVAIERLGVQHEDGGQVAFHLEISGCMTEEALSSLLSQLQFKK